jgi:fatty-acyl-CoA synthase
MGDSLRLAGFLVNPAEIEQTIETLPGVAACQVVAAQSGNKAVPVAFVILKVDASALPEQWTSSCKRRMAGFKVPVHFEVVSAFPTIESANAVKIQKNRLRDMAQAILDQRAP